jgi:hypothetical protein
MIVRALQRISIATALLFAAHSAEAALELGSVHALSFIDVDRHELSTADGHVTIVAVMVRADADKARAVGDRVPNEYKGDPSFRFVTLINFQNNVPSVFRAVTETLIRHRLDQEAPRVQKIYDDKRLTRKARNDLFVVADFDGSAVAKLGLEATSNAFVVFVFDRKGRLTNRWSEVPPAEALAAALKQAK